MLNITVTAVGSLKEKYLADACREYEKRLGAFCKLRIIEINEHRLGAKPSAAEIQQCLAAERDELLGKLPSKAYIIPLCIEGASLSSEMLADKLAEISLQSSNIAFVIGGSHGLCDDLKKRADFKLSMSSMTFPHQLARVMLLEQVYRAFSIMSGMKYHK